MEENQIIATPRTEQIETSDNAEDIADKLSLLKFVLADPEQELSVQHPGAGATTFTCFPKLPIEVRLMIWRGCFPRGRKVMLEVQWSLNPYYQYYGCSTPITLGVNGESRNETKKHYVVYIQTTEVLDGVKLSDRRKHYFIYLSKLPPKPKPIFYNPSRDWLTLNAWDLSDPLSQNLFKIMAERSQSLGRVQAVNIEGLFAYPPYLSEEQIWPKWRGLLNFHSLKEIRCVSLGSLVMNTECKDMLSKFFNDGFESERSKFPACEIPKVIVFDNWAQLIAKLNG